MRIWVDLTNSPHVLVLRPVIRALEAQGTPPGEIVSWEEPDGHCSLVGDEVLCRRFDRSQPRFLLTRDRNVPDWVSAAGDVAE